MSLRYSLLRICVFYIDFSDKRGKNVGYVLSGSGTPLPFSRIYRDHKKTWNELFQFTREGYDVRIGVIFGNLLKQIWQNLNSFLHQVGS